MNDEISEPLFELHDIWAAFSILTRLPVPVDHTRAGLRANKAVWAYPLVGAGIGAIAAVFGYALLASSVPVEFCAAICILVLIATSGALHEDGLADCADGFWGGNSTERRLEIMKDSAIGAYGMLALIGFSLAQWSAVAQLMQENIFALFIGLGAISRLPMVLGMWIIPNARANGMSASVGMPSAQSVQLATGLSIIIAVICFGWQGIFICTAALIAAGGLFALADKKIGGQTGDVLGASQKCAELGAFLCIFML
ncbi:adenosylcobinamide-GDP ribazoletransferase [Amylibacter marinus]|uniref:Adenosylcobinamide-GDP ribazoletransferase n=1 Tax=Amylibacter marinus TaxID=1475483 RepID=A0ABQ5VX75_9RHOB|nr:adenosylcobinamide-GDP ribazoletransferase [Amylibacter marinus]GLQ36035.1 adenosylcobinamide-GDP ribazoletransferase [Amylibacter marinus]